MAVRVPALSQLGDRQHRTRAVAGKQPGGVSRDAPRAVAVSCGGRLNRAVATALASTVKDMHSPVISIMINPSFKDRAAGARNGSPRAQTPADSPRPTRILCAGERLPVRLCPTVSDSRNLHGMQKVRVRIPLAPRTCFPSSEAWIVAGNRIAGGLLAFGPANRSAHSCRSGRFFAVAVTFCAPRSRSPADPPLTREFPPQIPHGSHTESPSGHHGFRKAGN
jgi:hypothetical protein